MTAKKIIIIDFDFDRSEKTYDFIKDNGINYDIILLSCEKIHIEYFEELNLDSFFEEIIQYFMENKNSDIERNYSIVMALEKRFGDKDGVLNCINCIITSDKSLRDILKDYGLKVSNYNGE